MAHEPVVPAAISTPRLDPLLVGGALAFLFVALLAYPPTEALLASAVLAVTLNLVINYPHFMASYRIIYGSKASIRKYFTSTIIVPLVLITWGIAALAVAEEHGIYVHLLGVLSGLYIGLHYTGQTWGMMAAFGGLEGVPFQPIERRLIRGGLYALALWHAAKYARFHAQISNEYIVYATHAVTAATMLVAAGFVTGIAGILRYMRRIERRPPTEAWIAWLSIYLWYAVFASSDGAAFWVQIAHALQYLIFPARLYVNADTPANPTRPTYQRLLRWYVPLFVLGAIAFYGIPTAVDLYGPATWGVLAPLVISAILNIHHFYTDSCIWKLRDPAVRETLFRHIASGKKAIQTAEMNPTPQTSDRTTWTSAM